VSPLAKNPLMQEFSTSVERESLANIFSSFYYRFVRYALINGRATGVLPKSLLSSRLFINLCELK